MTQFTRTSTTYRIDPCVTLSTSTQAQALADEVIIKETVSGWELFFQFGGRPVDQVNIRQDDAVMGSTVPVFDAIWHHTTTTTAAGDNAADVGGVA